MTCALASQTGARNLSASREAWASTVWPTNGKCYEPGDSRDFSWIQPASGDAGGAVGAALAAYPYPQGATPPPEWES